MELGALKIMVAGLLTWIHAHSDLPMPHGQPTIDFVPASQLAEIACNGKCDALGFSPDRDISTIYLERKLDIEHDVCQRSILVHELVHYMQHRAKRFEDEPPDVAAHWREMEALQVQRVYLGQFGRRLFIGPREIASMGMGYPFC